MVLERLLAGVPRRSFPQEGSATSVGLLVASSVLVLNIAHGKGKALVVLGERQFFDACANELVGAEVRQI